MQSLPEGEARVLAAMIRVMNHPGLRFAAGDCHVERVYDQFGAQMICHRPADDPTTEDIEHDRQIEKAHPRRNIGDVRDPEPVRCSGGEVALHAIRSGKGFCAPTRRGRALPTMTARESGDAEQAGDPFATTADACGTEFGMNAWRAIRPPAPDMNGANLDIKRLIRLGTRTRRSPAPRIEPTARHAKHATEQ